MNILHRRTLNRRTFLRGTGVALALPWLESMSSLARAATTAGGIAESERPRRSIFCFWGLGINGRDFTPVDFGPGYTPTKILEPLNRLRDEFTILTGMQLSHGGGHEGDRSFLTGCSTHTADAKLRISCDQELAEAVGKKTRFASLVLGIKRGTGFGNPQDNSTSWTRSGTPIPSENRPHIIFDRLFRNETPAEITARESGAGRTASVLDAVRDEAKRLNSQLGKDDQQKLDEYFTSVRDVEARMATDLQWLHKPKPEVEPIDFGKDPQALDPTTRGGRQFDYRRYQRLMYDIIALALQTDSTRVIGYKPRMDLSDGTYTYGFMGCPYDYHTMTHHGEDPDKLKWLTQVDTWYAEDWAYFIDRLEGVKEGDGTLLDHTLLVWGSSGGTVNAHNRTDLPTMLAGGQKLGIKHQGHLLKKDMLLGNLWQTMFGAMGVKVPDNFQGGEANGIVKELV